MPDTIESCKLNPTKDNPELSIPTFQLREMASLLAMSCGHVVSLHGMSKRDIRYLRDYLNNWIADHA